MSTTTATAEGILRDASTMPAPPDKSEASPTEPCSNSAEIERPLEVTYTTKLAGMSDFFHNVDGGARGWASVAGAWLIQFSMLGAVMAFGSYQTFYQDRWLPAYSHSTISWIGSLQIFMEFFLGVFGGFLLDSGHWRWTVGGGSVLFVFTFFMLSLCRAGQYAFIILSQGVGMGAGLGFAYLPVSGIVSKHFKKRRALAMGIITTGGSIGGFVLSLLGNKLLYPDLGFPWTVRISAFIVLGACMIANLLLSDIRPEEHAVVTQNPKKGVVEATGDITTTEITTVLPSEKDNEATSSDPEGRGESVQKEHKPRTIKQMLQDPAYLAVISMGFVVGLGLYFPMFAIHSFALDHGVPSGLASWLLPLLNLTSVLGRTIPNWLADRYGLFELYIPCTLAAGVVQFAIGGATNSVGVVIVSILYGFFSGSIPSLYFPMISSLDPDVASTGMRLGVACLPVSVESLVGPPIAEALVGSSHNWWRGLGYAGATQIISAMLLTFAWTMEKKRKRAKHQSLL